MSDRKIVAGLLGIMILVAQPVRVQGWNGRGHMLVAFIAFRHLTPEAKKEVGRLLKLNPEFKAWTKEMPPSATEEARTLRAFLQASIWPDFIRDHPKYVTDGPNNGNTPPSDPSAWQNIGYADFNRHKYWHFKNVPFSDDGTTTKEPATLNAQSEIELMRTALVTRQPPTTSSRTIWCGSFISSGMCTSRCMRSHDSRSRIPMVTPEETF